MFLGAHFYGIFIILDKIYIVLMVKLKEKRKKKNSSHIINPHKFTKNIKRNGFILVSN